MKKKLLLVPVILLFTGIVLLACTTGYGGDENITREGFYLKVTVNKTRVKVGDTVTASAIFKNLSGKNIEAELPGWIAAEGGKSKDDILRTFLAPSDNAFLDWSPPDILFEPLPKILIKSGVEISQKFKYTLKESGIFVVVAGAFFIAGNDIIGYDWNDPGNVKIICNSKKIKVR